MSLEQLTRKEIDTRRLDSETAAGIRRWLDRRRDHLSPEEYEALRSLGRAVQSGLVVMGPDW